MARRGITRRWILNGLGVIVGLLVVFEVAFAVVIRSYYYQRVETSLYTRARSLSDRLSAEVKQDSFDFESSAWEEVEHFQDKEREKMELQVLDAGGNVLVSSTGFRPLADEKPDFVQALQAVQRNTDEDRGVWRGRNAAGEKITAMTVLVRYSDGTICGAVRYLVSMEKVDSQILLLIAVMLLFGMAVIFFVMLSSSYFVSSILNPITEIGQTARKIALGDYDSRIEKRYDDEMGDLCDTINYMAGEISAAERMQNDFISSVSHELRTPLTAIKGWSETLRQGGAADEELMNKGLEVISSEAERLSGIVEELLDFSRMQGGHMTMRFGRMDVLAELEEAVVLFRERAKREDIDLVYIEGENLRPSREIRTGSSRCSSTSSTTRSNIPMRADGYASRPFRWAATSRSSSATAAWGSPRVTCPISKTNSIRPTGPGLVRESGWPSQMKSSAAIRAAWKSTARKASAPP